MNKWTLNLGLSQANKKPVNKRIERCFTFYWKPCQVKRRKANSSVSKLGIILAFDTELSASLLLTWGLHLKAKCFIFFILWLFNCFKKIAVKLNDYRWISQISIHIKLGNIIITLTNHINPLTLITIFCSVFLLCLRITLYPATAL